MIPDFDALRRVDALSEFKKAAISYIAGFAGIMTRKRTWCSVCSAALGSVTAAPETTFLAYKDNGGLFKPSKCVIVICEETEKCFQRLLASKGGNLPRPK